jgi:hypothetical protein
VRGQYLVIWRATRFDVWNRRQSYDGDIQARFVGHAATADEAKAIAQADANSLLQGHPSDTTDRVPV